MTHFWLIENQLEDQFSIRVAHTYYGGSAVDEILFIVHLNVHTYLVEYVTIFSNNYYQAYNQVRSDP